MKKSLLISLFLFVMVPGIIVPQETLSFSKRIKMFRKYMREKCVIKGISTDLVKEGNIPAICLAMLGTIVGGGLGVKGLVMLRAAQKNNEDKKKEIFPGIIIENPDTVSNNNSPETSLKKSQEAPAGSDEEAELVLQTKTDKKEVESLSEKRSVTFATELANKEQSATAEQTQEFPEESNNEYDLPIKQSSDQSTSTVESLQQAETDATEIDEKAKEESNNDDLATTQANAAEVAEPFSISDFEMNGVSLSNIPTPLQSSESQSSEQNGNSGNPAVDESEPFKYVPKKELVRDVPVKKKKKQGKRKADGKEIDLAALGIFDEDKIVENEGVADDYSLLKEYTDNAEKISFKKESKKGNVKQQLKNMNQNKRDPLSHEEVVNEKITQDCRTSMLADEQNTSFSMEELSKAVQVVGNAENNPTTTIELRLEYIPQDKKDLFGKLLSNYIKKKKFTDSLTFVRQYRYGRYFSEYGLKYIIESSNEDSAIKNDKNKEQQSPFPAERKRTLQSQSEYQS